jgi:hypothetical protein
MLCQYLALTPCDPVPARALVCNAIKAAVEAIEASDYRVMLLPMQFALCSMPDDGQRAILRP